MSCFKNWAWKIRSVVLGRLRRSALSLTDALVLLRRAAPEECRVLLVRLDEIGDFVLWQDAAKEIRKLFPSDRYEITLAANYIWAPLAEKLSYYDRVWPIDKNRFIENFRFRYRILSKIRTGGFHTVIHPVYSRGFYFGDAIVRASGAVERIGFDGDCINITPGQKAISDTWYTCLVQSDDPNKAELQRNAEFLRRLGHHEFEPGLPKLPIGAQLPGSFPREPFYVLVPGAGHVYRRWPILCFVEIARRLYEATGWLGIICGDGKEHALGERLAEETALPIQNWSGRTSIAELTAVIERARLVVTNETAAVHIASAVSAPCVCVLGGGHYGRFFPYPKEISPDRPTPVAVTHPMPCFGCDWCCIYHVAEGDAVPCIKEISLQEVWQAIQDILEKEPWKIRPHQEI